jgi:predicted permease
VREPEQLVSFHQSGGAARLSYLDYVDYRIEVRAFQDVAAFFPIVPASFGGGGEPQRLSGQLVTTNYFPVLGAEPYLGRGFMSDENRSRVAVISDGLWKQNLGSDPAIVGKTVLLSGARYNVVGVAPPGFQGSVRGLRSDFWVPLGLYAQVIPLLAREGPLEQLRDYPWLFVDARLKPGVSKTEAQAAVRVVTQRLEEIYRSKGAKRNVRLVQAGSLPLALGTVKLLLEVLMVVVGLVLLVACANVANLLLARSAARQKEMGIRLSVGATRARLVRQLLVESIALSMLGGVLGLGLALAGTSAARGFQSSLPIPAAVHLSIDSRVLLFTFALSVMTGVVFGLVPALRSTKPELTSMLRMDISGFVAGRQFGLTHGLVVVQKGRLCLIDRVRNCFGTLRYIVSLSLFIVLPFSHQSYGRPLFHGTASLALNDSFHASEAMKSSSGNLR